MYRIIDERATGKTGRLMLLAKESNGVIVCNNPNAMRQKARAYGITGIDYVSYSDFITGAGSDLGKYFIDELESFVSYAQNALGLRGTFSGYTISQE